MNEDTKYKLDNYLELLEEISEKTDDTQTALALLHELSKRMTTQCKHMCTLCAQVLSTKSSTRL